MIDTSVNRGTFLGIPSPAPKNFIVDFFLGHPVYIRDLRMDEFIDVFRMGHLIIALGLLSPT